MIAVFQRVSGAWVEVEGEELSRIGKGAVVLVGVESGDTDDDAAYVAEKCGSLRVFDDENGRLNLSVLDVDGSVLLVSQFTLCADCRKGRRPSFASAAHPDEGKRLYELVASRLREKGTEVQTGRFQAHMGVHLTNDGPVTVIVDSRKRL
jgi:D-tyrosyl-tRNA(Tyr) deacylase